MSTGQDSILNEIVQEEDLVVFHQRIKEGSILFIRGNVDYITWLKDVHGRIINILTRNACLYVNLLKIPSSDMHGLKGAVSPTRRIACHVAQGRYHTRRGTRNFGIVSQMITDETLEPQILVNILKE